MLKKTIATIVTLLMLISMFSACTPTQTTPAPKTNKSACPYTGPTVTFTAFAMEVGVKENIESPAYKIYKKAVGNIEIKWEIIPQADIDTKAKIYLNSGEIPDLFWYRSPDLMKDYSSSGLFLDFNKYKAFTPNWTAATIKNPALKVYQATGGEQFIIHGIDNDYPEETFFANKTLLDKLGIAIPKNLAELETAMQKVKAADPTVTPFHTFWGIPYAENYFGASLNARSGMYFDLADKKWKHAITSPTSKYKDLITLLADFYKKGYLNAEFSTMSDDQTKTLMASSKWAFSYTYGSQMNLWYGIDNNAALPIEIVPILSLSAEGVKPNVNISYVSDSPYWGYSVSSKCKNPELASSLIDTMLGDTVANAFQWGAEGTSYTKDASGKKTWIPAFLAKGNQAALDVGIWNILTPRYITKRDDSSILQKGSPLEQNMEKMLVAALKSGAIDSYYYRAAPTFTDAENEELSTIMTAITTKVTEGEALFVLGKRPISEWDKFVAEVKATGNIDRAVAIYNGAKQSFDRAEAIDRNYITP